MATFLARIQVADNRQVDELTLIHWHDVCGDLELVDALAALVMHCRETTEYLKPAHIIANVTRVHRDLRGRGMKFLTYRYGSSSLVYDKNRRYMERIGRALNNTTELQTIITEYEASLVAQDAGFALFGVGPLVVPRELLIAGDGKLPHPDAWMNQ